ncbi:MAG: glycogen/starch/alpha-glucan phosphorylase [Burkholderiales bacterium]|nr:glycogen/starch/alpha-glucan phosphorylase [Burkholderiales bacterium]
MAVLRVPDRRAAPGSAEPVRTGLGVEAIKRDFIDNLFYIQARFPEVASDNDYYQALAYTVRDRLLERWVRSSQTYKRTAARTVCYFSAEYLPGPHLGANLLNLGIDREVRQAMSELGLDLDRLLDQEEEPGLGNGGLGRLAACYMESLATLQIPAIAYGIRYEFGIFDQEIRDGWQVERSDKWLHYGNPWEIPRPSITFDVKLGGRTESWRDGQGRYRVRWIPQREVRGVAYDTPILGHRVDTAGFLRLWSAAAVESFDFAAFNVGDYYRAVDEKIQSETISKVLYPNDEPGAGKALRLAQQYFFVSCSLRDMIRIHLQRPGNDVRTLHEKYTVQLNDTHPSLAVPELMRLLVDEYLLGWDEAWAVVRRMFAYTNHTLLPEALEAWPLSLFSALLPRHLEIVYELNRRFLDEVRLRYPGDEARVARLSLIDEGGGGRVRMANLACVGSHSVNGVAALHTALLKASVLRDFAEFAPERFNNKTNGVTPRRFVLLANPGLSALVSEAIGDEWITRGEALRELEALAADAAFRARWRAVKRANKARLADLARAAAGVELDPDWLFDIHAKRIHEYKRQHLNVLHIVTRYLRLKRGVDRDAPPRAFVFAGKAAPGYFMAKRIIKLINSVAEVVNGDPEVSDLMRVVFLPNFNVKESQVIYPAADLSEQISLAGKEASGTGNMKFAMNGAATIGTLDGANVEIREEVGATNFFLFGLTVEEVRAARDAGYRPRDRYERDPELRAAVDLVAGGHFSHGDRDLFRPLVDALLHHDEYLLFADYRSYIERQDEVACAYRDPERWVELSILNVARSGKFSSDRAIREYCREIWRVSPVTVSAFLPEEPSRAPGAALS